MRWSVLLVCFGAAANAQSPKPLTLQWELATPNTLPQTIMPDQHARPYLYLAQKSGGLAILEHAKSNSAPTLVATVTREQLANCDVMHVTQQNDLLYLALGDFFNAQGAQAGLAVIRVTKPAAPKVVGLWQSPEKWHGAATVLVNGNYAFLGAMTHGVVVLDIRDPAKPTHVTTYQPEVDFPIPKPTKVQHPNARGFALKGNHLYVAYDAGGLRVLDISTPAKPREIGRYINVGMGKKQQAYNNLIIEGNTAYVAIDYAGLEILDIREPQKIKSITWWNPWEAHTLKNIWLNSPGHTNQLAYDTKRKLVYLAAGDSELRVVDVSEVKQPKLVAQYGEPKDQAGAWGLALAPDVVYLTYIKAAIPFQGTWSGVKAIKR